MTSYDNTNILANVYPRTADNINNIQGVSINWRNTWSSSVFYQINDAVAYLGSSYIAITANINNIPTNTLYWNVLAQQGQMGPAGSSLRVMSCGWDYVAGQYAHPSSLLVSASHPSTGVFIYTTNIANNSPISTFAGTGSFYSTTNDTGFITYSASTSTGYWVFTVNVYTRSGALYDANYFVFNVQEYLT